MSFTPHFPRPKPSHSGHTPTKGRQPCAVCGAPLVRKGRHLGSDGVRGQWVHVVRSATLGPVGKENP